MILGQYTCKSNMAINMRLAHAGTETFEERAVHFTDLTIYPE